MAIAESGIQQLVGESLGLLNPTWHENPNRLSIEVRLIPEDEGGFSVYTPRLPGACSQGETVDEALANVREALSGVIAQYKADGVAVPWTPEVETPALSAEELSRRVVVDITE